MGAQFLYMNDPAQSEQVFETWQIGWGHFLLEALCAKASTHIVPEAKMRHLNTNCLKSKYKTADSWNLNL